MLKSLQNSLTKYKDAIAAFFTPPKTAFNSEKHKIYGESYRLNKRTGKLVKISADDSGLLTGCANWNSENLMKREKAIAAFLNNKPKGNN